MFIASAMNIHRRRSLFIDIMYERAEDNLLVKPIQSMKDQIEQLRIFCSSTFAILSRLRLMRSCPGGLWGTRWAVRGPANQKVRRAREPQGLGHWLCLRTRFFTTQKHKSLSKRELCILIRGEGGLLESTLLVWSETVQIWYTPKTWKLFYSLEGSINDGVGQGRHPVSQDCSITRLSQSKYDIPHELGQVTNAKACMSKKPLSLVRVKYEYKKSQLSHISWNSQRYLYL